MENKKISDGDKELIRKRCQVLNGSRGTCVGCPYYPGNQRTKMFDCIGFVNQLLNWAEIAHYGAGCTTMWNHKANWDQQGTIKDMPDTPCCVFQDNPKDKTVMQHIGYHIGGGIVIHCSKEVKKQKLSEYPWTHYAIPKGMGGDVPVSHKTIRKGSTGPDVVECQEDLIQLGYDLTPYGADGKFGAKTETAVKAFQKASGLTADGIVGPKTWEALDKAVEPGPEPTPTPVTTLYTVHIPHLTEYQADALIAAYAGSWKTAEGSEN